jgi:hypothetical protein
MLYSQWYLYVKVAPNNTTWFNKSNLQKKKKVNNEEKVVGELVKLKPLGSSVEDQS